MSAIKKHFGNNRSQHGQPQRRSIASSPGATGLLLALLLLGLPVVATEPDPLADRAAMLDPQLTAAVSGGYWQQGSEGGGIRVLVYSGGFEHITSRVVLQWLTETTPERPAGVVNSVPVKELDGQYALDDPRVTRQPDGSHRVTLSGVHSYSGESVNLLIATSGPGRYRLLEFQSTTAPR